MQLLDLPEETIEQILELLSPTPDLLLATSVHRTLTRIGIPLLYRTLTLTDDLTASLLARTLSTAPAHAHHIRTLTTDATYPVLAPLFLAIGTATPPTLHSLDLTIDAPALASSPATNDPITHPSGEKDRASAQAIAAAFPALAPGPRTLVLRRRKLVASLGRGTTITSGLARALPSWPALSTAHITFRLLPAPPDPNTDAHAHAHAPHTLVQGLACAPGLTRIRAPFPPAWSAHDALLQIGANPSLRRIELTVSRIKACARATPVFVPVSASDADEAGEDAEREEGMPALRGPIEVTSRLGRFYDRTPRMLVGEDVVVGVEDLWRMLGVGREAEEGGGTWLEEARTRPRLLGLLVGEGEEGL